MYKSITLKIKKATILVSQGEDKVCLLLDLPTPYPELKYDACAQINTRHGYGEKWCKEILEITPEIIKV